MHPRARSIWLVFVVAGVLSFVVDYGSRIWAQRSLPAFVGAGTDVPLVASSVVLRLSVDRGSAFGALHGVDRQRVLALVLGVLVTLMVLDALWRMQRGDYRKARVVGALGVVAGTAAVDFIERASSGYTTDFVVMRRGASEWPAFSLGDAAGWIAILYMLLVLCVAQTQRPFWRHRLSSFRSARTLAGTGVRLVSLALFLIGVGMVLQWISMVAGAIGGHAPAGVELIIGAAISLTTGFYLQLFGRRLQQPRLHELDRVDVRAPVLFLRSFRKERARLPRRNLWALFAVWRPDYLYDAGRWTFERALTSILDHEGPVIGLGSDQDVIQPLGAAREYVPIDNWKTRFDELRERAGLVVMIPDDTPSIRYELETLRDQRTKLVVVAPSDLATWTSLRADVTFLPEIRPETIAVRFAQDGTPTVIDAQKPITSPWQRLHGLERVFSAPT